MTLYKNEQQKQQQVPVQSVLIGVSAYSYSEYDTDLNMTILKKDM
jgi:hypothetical protein